MGCEMVWLGRACDWGLRVGVLKHRSRQALAIGVCGGGEEKPPASVDALVGCDACHAAADGGGGDGEEASGHAWRMLFVFGAHQHGTRACPRYVKLARTHGQGKSEAAKLQSACHPASPVEDRASRDTTNAAHAAEVRRRMPHTSRSEVGR